MKKMIAVTLVSLLLLTGCGSQAQSATAPAAVQEETASAPVQEGQRLHLAVVPEEGSLESFPMPQSTEKTYGEITYVGVKDVRLQLSGGEKALAQALSDGDISLGEISAYAQLDARNGICQEEYTSKNGLAQYCYTYPEYRLYLVHDIYELPNGTAIPVQELRICDPSEEEGVTSVYTDEAGNILDMEDWGLTWTVAEVTPTSAKLRCTQQGGQQLGQLVVTTCMVSRQDGSEGPQLFGVDIPLTMGGDCEITLDWAEELGALAPGQYTLRLGVEDRYDPDGVHPLLLHHNYKDIQGYPLDVTVEEAQP